MEDLFGLVGHQIEGRYAVDAVVAAGGFGVVYHATHTALGSPVALKVLKVPDTLPEHLRGPFAEQFLGEARIISQLQHPAIVRVTDFGIITFQNGYRSPWMALEWIDGVTLAKDLADRRGAGGRSPRACLELMTPVLEALAVAHAKGIAHRDIKPGNLMLPALDPALASAQGARASRNAVPRMRLLDFGIAKVLDDNDGPASGQTQTGSLMASYSPRYAAPEQASGTRTGPWTDVHALGLVLTEMLVDAAPYQSADKMEIQIQVMQSQRPTPARFGVDVGPWEPVLARALALRPSERYANAAELLAALEAVVPEAKPLVGAAPTVPVPHLVRPLGTEPISSSTTAPTTASVPMVAPRRATWPLGLAAVAVFGALAAGAVKLASSADPTSPDVRPAAPPPVAAPSTQAAALRAAPPTPPTPPAPSVATPSVAAPPLTADAGAATPAPPPATGSHGGRVHSGRVRPPQRRPVGNVVVPAPTPAPDNRNRPW